MQENHIGIVIKKIRNEKNISQVQLADASSLDRTYISMIERGIKQPTITTLFKIAKALQVSPSYIVQQIEERHEDS